MEKKRDTVEKKKTGKGRRSKSLSRSSWTSSRKMDESEPARRVARMDFKFPKLGILSLRGSATKEEDDERSKTSTKTTERAKLQTTQSQVQSLEKEAEELRATNASDAERTAAEIAELRKSLEESSSQCQNPQGEEPQIRREMEQLREEKRKLEEENKDYAQVITKQKAMIESLEERAYFAFVHEALEVEREKEKRKKSDVTDTNSTISFLSKLWGREKT
jgi:chromosome segregation ATPase